MDSAEVERFAEERLAQRHLESLRTSGHAWRTAAVMTCLLPLGVPFGLLGLWLMRGLGAAIDGKRAADAEKKLGTGRIVVLVGTCVGALSTVVALFAMLQFASTLPDDIEQLREQVRSEP